MCGINGLISKHGVFQYYVDDLFTNLIRMGSIRGEDSTGIFGVTKEGHCDVLKGDTDGYIFTRTDNFGKFLKRAGQYRIMVAHNRAATTGSVSAANAHPFQEKHIVLVHNGTISNKEDLNKEVEVDSHAIAHALAEHDAVQALGKIDGAYALVWWDESDGTLNLARNTQRPLFIVEFESIYAICSEPGLPLWLNGRDNRKYSKIDQVPSERILSIKLNDISKGFFEIPYEEYKYWKDKSRHTPSYHSTVEQPKPAGNIVDLKAHKSSQIIKAGDRLQFKLYDSQPADGVEVLLGHPMFGQDLDTNIIVRAVLPRGTSQEELLTYFDSEYWVGEVANFRTVQGISVIYMKNFEPYEEVVDNAGNVSNLTEVEDAVKSGCGKCKGPVTSDEAKKGIVRKRQNGTWRIVCPKCLEETIRSVQETKPGTALRARTH